MLLLAAGVVAVLLALAAYGFRNLLKAQLSQALVERPDFWNAAWAIFMDHPVVGTGLSTYGHHFLAYRPTRHAVDHGEFRADAPHSVPLAMLAEGGVILGLGYLAFVSVVGFVLLRGVSRSSGHERIALAGFGGVWLGYQMQSLISIDVPPLVLLHWLSAGAIVAVAAPPAWRTVHFGASQRRKTSGRVRSRKPPANQGLLKAGMVLATLLALSSVWWAVSPLRADLLAGEAVDAVNQGDPEGALALLADAGRVNPSEGSYLFTKAEGYAALGRHEEALKAASAAARRDPGSMEYALLVGEQAVLADQPQLAEHWYREAVRRDPRRPETLAYAAHFFVERGNVEQAKEYLVRALRLEPSNREVRSQLARIESVESVP